MRCPACGTASPPRAKFCAECGGRLADACPRCGHQVGPEAKFCQECGGPLGTASVPQIAAPRADAPESYTPKHLADKILASRAAVEGERKQVTVLFADIKGSTELIGGLETEEAQRLLDGAVTIMMDAVHRFEGTVCRLMGDGLMALFGAPIAHEDHAVRACYATLALQDGMRRYAGEVFARHGLRVEARVGLNSGEVIVRLISDDLHMDYTAMGQTVHLAARMEQLAREGTALLTPETLALVEGYVQVGALGHAPVKGLADPVDVFELQGIGAARTRLQVAAARGLTRFVGRDDELDAIHRALERAGAGRGQIAALVGEAGVGKSRLVWEATHSHRTRDWLVLESGSVSYGKATAYLPVIDLLKVYCRIEARDDYRAVREKLTGKLLALDQALKGALTPLLALLDVPIDPAAGAEQAAWTALDPAQRRRRTLDAVKRLLLRESGVQPLLLVFEDLHWIDSETQALLDNLVDSLPTARLLLLVNYRPEYRHQWGSKTYYTQLRVDPLPPESAEAMLAPLLGDDPTVRPVRRLLIERTEGNPFFLEECVRGLVEVGALVGERGAYRLTRPVEEVRVPATVQAILASRIDRLAAGEKRLLQTAAVVGKDVPYALLRAVAELPDEELKRGLMELRAAELVYERSLFPELELTFKHALTHEVAYGSLLHDRRRALHARIVDVIESTAGDRLAEQVERLAHHAVRGEVWPKAVDYLRQAFARVMAHSAQQQAAAYADQALAALEHLPDSRDRIELAIDLRFQLRHALWPLCEFARIRDVLVEAEHMAETLGDRRRRGWAALYMCTSFYGVAEHDRAVAAGESALALGTAVEDETLRILAQVNLGQALVGRTAFATAVDPLCRALSLLGEDRLRDRLGQATLPSVLAQVALVRAQVELGRFADATAVAADAVRIAEDAGHPSSLALAWWVSGLPYLRRGDATRAIPAIERGLEICRERGLPAYPHWIAPSLGAAYVLAGRADEAAALLEQRIAHDVEMNLLSQHTLTVVYLGEAFLRAGRDGDALRCAEEALELSRARGERGFRAWALRLLGAAASSLGPGDDRAVRAYGEALGLAHDLGMRPLVAHCHWGLGAHHQIAGNHEQAHDHIVAATTTYREMEMQSWLDQIEARTAKTPRT